MRKFILLSFLFIGLAFTQSKVNKVFYAPGEIILKYQKYGVQAKGADILIEHKNILEKLKRKFTSINIISSAPVFRDVVNEMINENKTEGEIFNKKTANKSVNINLLLVKKTNFSNILLLKIETSGNNIEELAASINSNPDILAADGIKIEYAEPNYLKKINIDSNDPLYQQQWSHQVTNIEPAWAVTQGSPDIKIAIIDTGVDPTHPDLSANLLSGFDFVDVDTVAYLNSGYKLLPGEDYTKTDNNCTDFNGHGTHCAGIAAAVGGNGIGVKGVAPNCKILPVRAGFSVIINGAENGLLESTSIVNAILYAVDQGANVISMSFGGDYSNLEEEAIRYASYRNVVLVAAAGNDATAQKSYPAGYDEVLAITSINKSKAKSSFSNYSAWTDIAAPGEDIISTVPVKGGAISDTSGYRSISGTSMAAPYMAGVAALLLSKNPGMSNNLVFQVLRTSTDTNYTSRFYIGTGIINVYKAVSGSESCISKITSPHNKGNVFVSDGDIEISGRASGKNFKSYIFDYSNYTIDNPDWQPLPDFYTVPVDSGYLGTVHISQAGVYYIRLRVISSLNTEYTDVIGPVTVDKRIKAGWPLPISEGNLSTPAIADIDKDGKMEAVITCSNGEIFVVDQNGNNKPGWPVFVPATDIFNTVLGYTSPAIADIDNDGKDEVIVKDGISIYVYSYDGKMKNGWPVHVGTGVYGNAMIGAPVAADIDNDGKKEILTTYPESITDNNRHGGITVIKSDGKIMPGWPVQIPLNTSFATLSCTPVVSDLDGDGNVEIILQCLDDIARKGYLYVFDKSGKILSGWPKEIGNGSDTSPIAVDIDNDGQNEIIAASFVSTGPNSGYLGVFAFNKTGELLNGWPANLYNGLFGYYSLTAGISAGDINNDGYKEIIVGSNGSTYSLWTIDRQGKTVWSLSNLTTEYVQTSVPLVADINGDNNPEILISKYQNANINGKILVASNTGQIMPDLTFTLPEKLGATPAIGDIDGDGRLELICNTQKGNVYCWDLNSPANSAKTMWATYQANNQRTGSIDLPKTIPAAAQLTEPLNKAVNQPVKILFKWLPVEGAVSYWCQISDDSLFGNIVRENTSITDLNFSADSLKNGVNYFWRVKAKNKIGYSEWSETRSLTTIVATPMKVVLLFPVNNLNSQPVSINFKWNKSLLAEKYRLQLSEQEQFGSFIINDSTLTDTLKNVTGLKEGTKYYWKVSAINNAGESSFSEIRNFTTLLDAPDSLAASLISKGKIKLSWKDKTGNISVVKIERKINDNYVLIDSVKAGITTYTDTTFAAYGTFQYRVNAYTANAKSLYSNEASVVISGVTNYNSIPVEYSIEQNYPNPFNPSTDIVYGLPAESHVKIAVINILGKVVAEAANSVQTAGFHKITFNASGIASGVYFYFIESNSTDGSKQFRQVKKMLLLK